MYQPKDFSHLLGLPGFSDTTLKTHFEFYEGYVKNVNTLSTILENNTTGTPEYTEIKRRFGWEWNGMRLHEIYFGSMSKTPIALEESTPLREQIKKDFGDFENWKNDFAATASMRGIGWAILCYDRIAKRLFNVWINEHDTGHLAGAIPLLPLDVFEHAFLPDYGTKRNGYIEAFLKIIDWKEINKLFCNDKF